MKAKPTIRDVAKLANVSISTASRVMNNPEMVSEDKRHRVTSAIEQLGYFPNALARGLIHKRTQTFGVLIPNISNPYSADLLRGMEDAARKAGNDMIIGNTDNNRNRMQDVMQMLYERQIDGLVFTSEPVYPDYYELLHRLKMPVVLASTHSFEYDIPSVKINDETAGYDATAYLFQRGHQCIAMISGPSHDPIAGMPRLQGFLRACREFNFSADPLHYIDYGNYSFQSGYDAMQRLLIQHPDLTAVFCASDEMAFGAISYLHERNIKVPEHISVIGFDDIRMASMYIPKLTTVRQPIYDIGFKSVEMLQEIIHSGSAAQLRTNVSHEIIERDSVRSV